MRTSVVPPETDEETLRRLTRHAIAFASSTAKPSIGMVLTVLDRRATSKASHCSFFYCCPQSPAVESAKFIFPFGPEKL